MGEAEPGSRWEARWEKLKGQVVGSWGRGFWVPKLRVVGSRICKGGGGFGRKVEPFVGFGLPLGYGVFFALRVGLDTLRP